MHLWRWLLLFLALAALRAEPAPLPWLPANPIIAKEAGVLESLDFIHRSGTYRTGAGELKAFALPPYGSVRHLGTEAELRDLPLGITVNVTLLPSEPGRPVRPIALETTTPADPKLTEVQRARFLASLKYRGIPGYIESTKGNEIRIILLSGDPAGLAKDLLPSFILNRTFALCVANDELRTWNPPVDKESPVLLTIEKLDRQDFGSSGLRLVCNSKYMLEGFRRGRYVRVFGHNPQLKDQPYGESLMGYGYARLQTEELTENPAKEYPEQFPFRTDFGNVHLPWFQPQGDNPPPRYSEHVVHGELISLNATARTGELRLEPSGQLLKFTLLPKAELKYLGATARTGDLPLKQRYRVHLHADAQGALTQASLLSDDFSYMTANVLTWRVEHVDLERGHLEVARQIPEVKNYNGDMEKPQDLGRAILRIDPTTRGWKGTERTSLQELKSGDAILANLTAELPGAPARCLDVWIGAETHKQITAQQAQKLTATKP